jgi:hypothetical protein
MPTRPWRSFGMSTCAPVVYVPRAFGGRSWPNLRTQTRCCHRAVSSSLRMSAAGECELGL